MDVQQVFRKGIRELGPLLDRSRLNPDRLADLDQFLDYFRHMVEKAYCPPKPYHPLGDMYVDYVHNFSINAAAFKVDGVEMIAINIGTIIAIYDFFLALLSCPLTLPDAGNAKAEAVDPSVLGSYIARDLDGNFWRFTPRDEERIRIAQYLTWIAAMFIFGHEIAHHTKGHVEFIASQTGKPTLYEYVTRGVDYSQIMRVRKCLEFGADENGAKASLGEWTELLNRMPTSPWVIKNRTRLWVIALGAMFRFFDRKPSGIKDYSCYFYPTPLSRFWQSMIMTELAVYDYAVYDYDEAKGKKFDGEAISAIRELDELWERAGIYAESFAPDRYRDSPPEQILELTELLVELEEKGLRALEMQRHVRIKQGL